MDNFALIIFGVTGNLAQIKLIPALYDLVNAGIIGPNFSVIGIGRSQLTPEAFQKFIVTTLNQPNRHHQHEIKSSVLSKLFPALHYISGDITDLNLYQKLDKFLSGHANCKNRIIYLAAYPELQPILFDNLHRSGLDQTRTGWLRLIIEKPIGTNLATAADLDKLLGKYFVEDQIYRLDHYLGRQTLQNLLTFRFGNGIFEPLLTAEFLDHIQITAAEDFGIGLRGGYYDSVGCLKDVGQNHILQMIALAMMASPSEFSNSAVTSRRIELISSLIPDPAKIVFGQYAGYTREPHVSLSSRTETFFALKTSINSDRFRGVPIYIRSGKQLARTVTEISFVFKNPIKRLFSGFPGGSDPNVLIYRIQPNEGIVLRLTTKVPGPEIKLEETYMQFCYRHLKTDLPDPYLRLIEDVLRGDQTFFNDAAEIEAQWRFTDPLSAVRGQPILYRPGTWGPEAANDLLSVDGRVWFEPSLAFCSL